jgi:hypothetical protein
MVQRGKIVASLFSHTSSLGYNEDGSVMWLIKKLCSG